MIISMKWNNKNNTFKIGEYTFKNYCEYLCWWILSINIYHEKHNVQSNIICGTTAAIFVNNVDENDNTQ